MSRLLAYSGIAMLLFTRPAFATVTLDAGNGIWRDTFVDLNGLAANRQGALVGPAGYTISSSTQFWGQPHRDDGAFARFSAPGMESGPTLTVQNPGSSGEALTLWFRRYDPGESLPDVAHDCFGAAFNTDPAACPNFPAMLVGEPWPSLLWGAPDQRYLPAATWDTLKPGFAFCRECSTCANCFSCSAPAGSQCGLCQQPLPQFLCKPGDQVYNVECLNSKTQDPGDPFTWSIGRFYNKEPLLSGVKATGLLPGRPYNATFVTSARLGTHAAHTTTPYLQFEMTETASKTVIAETLLEGEFISPSFTQDFSQMTPVTVSASALPALPGAVWDFRVWSLQDVTGNGGHAHCTLLGPAWVTAQIGVLASVPLDSMSVKTRWLDLSWDISQSTQFTDSQKSALAKGVPLTPVSLGYRVGASPAALPHVNSVAHGGENVKGSIGLQTVRVQSAPIRTPAGAPVTGRYFQWTATLYGRATAARLDSDLAPTDPKIHFGALRPTIRRIGVSYIACAAQAESRRIAPPSVKRWKGLRFTTDPPVLDPSTTGSALVEVLGEDGTVLLTTSVSGASLASVSPFDHKALRLRVSLDSDDSCTRRPVLTAWEVTWEPQGEDLAVVNCNSIRPDLGERCRMQIRVNRPGRARVEVHDAAGQSVSLLLDAAVPPEALLLEWDGRNDRGELVAAGVYFIVVVVPDGKEVRRLAVIR